MHDADEALEALRREVALFRHGLIADLAHLPPGSPSLAARHALAVTCCSLASPVW